MRWSILILLTLSGCFAGIEPSFESSSPQARNKAIVAEVGKGSSADLRHLVRMLEAKEPSTRLLAIEGLDRLTGQRLGYDFAADDDDRAEAVARWQAWAAERNKSRAPTPKADSAAAEVETGG
ncbi:MAG: hypothetical protein ACOYN0_07040 [Phycisphaerales bacterium]